MRQMSVSAFVLHRRSYGETSAWVECLTPQGRISILAKGVRSLRSRSAGLLQAFIPLFLQLNVSQSFYYLHKLEMQEVGVFKPVALKAQLFGLYGHELLLRLTPKDAHDPGLWPLYRHFLEKLQYSPQLGSAILWFEMALLQHLGHLFSFVHDAQGVPFAADRDYAFTPASGLEPVRMASNTTVKGEIILQIQNGDWFNYPEILLPLQPMLRTLLTSLLPKPVLHTLKLFNCLPQDSTS